MKLIKLVASSTMLATIFAQTFQTTTEEFKIKDYTEKHDYYFKLENYGPLGGKLEFRNESQTSLSGSTQIPISVATWIKDDVCWVSRAPKDQAQPSLRNCYTATESACCNYVEDQLIGGDYQSMIPEPC